MEMMDAREANTQSRAARESYARELFDPEVIERAIKQAVALGKAEVRVFQEVPVDLADTAAVADLIAQLTALGYITRWEHAAQKEFFGKRETMRIFRYRELLIAWD